MSPVLQELAGISAASPPRSSTYRADSWPEQTQETKMEMQMRRMASLPLCGTTQKL